MLVTSILSPAFCPFLTTFVYPTGEKLHKLSNTELNGRLAQLVERRTREHNVSGLYRCGFESPAGQLNLLIVFRMRR